MEKLPLILRLKRETHRKIAHAQDIIVNELYKKFPRAVLHGGTAIWRCHGGKRFSEDLDFYLPKQKEKINELFLTLEKLGFVINKKKVSDNSVYSDLEYERTSVRLEATFQNIKGVLSDYETVDGNLISIYSLAPEAFVVEKINTYLKRRKIRDLWDIFFLLKHVENSKRPDKEIKKLLDNYEKPVDEGDLKAIILDGIIPSSTEMLDYIKRKWEK